MATAARSILSEMKNLQVPDCGQQKPIDQFLRRKRDGKPLGSCDACSDYDDGNMFDSYPSRRGPSEHCDRRGIPSSACPHR